MNENEYYGSDNRYADSDREENDERILSEGDVEEQFEEESRRRIKDQSSDIVIVSNQNGHNLSG